MGWPFWGGGGHGKLVAGGLIRNWFFMRLNEIERGWWGSGVLDLRGGQMLAYSRM